ncbi:MAG: hypothetical protein AMXMBFR33_02760 [Candidatus Xenobia bacterium]
MSVDSVQLGATEPAVWKLKRKADYGGERGKAPNSQIWMHSAGSPSFIEFVHGKVRLVTGTSLSVNGQVILSNKDGPEKVKSLFGSRASVYRQLDGETWAYHKGDIYVSCYVIVMPDGSPGIRSITLRQGWP